MPPPEPQGTPETDPFLSSSPSARSNISTLLRSYTLDYALTIILWFLFGALTTSPRGFRQQFSVSDVSIQHTFAEHERVPMWLCGLLAGVLPLASVLTISAFRRSLYDAHSGTLGLLLTLALTTTLTDLSKLTVGRPRPDLLSRCLLPPNTTDAGPPSYGLVSPSLCTQPNAHILADGFKSFFSGHSSFSFAGLGFLSFYLAGKVGLVRGRRRGETWKVWVCGAPVVLAGWIAVTRVEDYRHHWEDVMVGSGVGWIISWFIYRLYYPPLSHPHSASPYAPHVQSFSVPDQPSTLLPLHQSHTQPAGIPEDTVPRPDGTEDEREELIDVGERANGRR